MVSWLKGLFRRWKTAAVTPAPAVLGLTLPTDPVPAPRMQRVLRWRGYEWVQRDGRDTKGKLTFVREAAVDGRPVPVEVQVLEADLELKADGTLTLRGRE